MKGPIIGRQTELELLEGLLDEAHGRPRALILEGAPGIGKLRVLAEALGRAAREGTTGSGPKGVRPGRDLVVTRSRPLGHSLCSTL